MDSDYREILNKAPAKKKENKKFFKKIKKRVPKNFDQQVHQFHEEVFDKIDCLKCANCCKTTGPLFNRLDIDRISKHLNMNRFHFEKEYLRVDEEGDWVLQKTPCSFLGADNYCTIYEVRPKACSGYPHTDHHGMDKILDLTLENTLICPAAYSVVEKMKEKFSS